MDAAGTLPFLRGQKSAKNPLDTARLLKMSIENTKLLHSILYRQPMEIYV